MTVIDRISKLKHPGTLHDFTWPQDLPEFGRYNLIYGWNGSGKTTISRLFRALEMQTAPANCEIEFSINGTVVRGPDFQQMVLPVRVFNRDFVLANVFQTGGGDVPPILVLGEDSVEKQAQVAKLKASLTEAQTEQHKRQLQKVSDENDLDKHCIQKARVVKDTLRSIGQNPYNNYDKSHYQRRTGEMLAAGDAKQYRLDDNTRASLHFQIHEGPKAQIKEIDCTFPTLPTFADDVSKLLEVSVVSAAITSLQDDQMLSSWVHQGIGLHDLYDVDHCLFCEQTLPQVRLSRLKAHFSTEYDQLIKNIDDKIVLLEQASKDTDSVVLPHNSQFYEDLSKEYESAVGEFKRVWQTASEALAFLVHALTQKKVQIFESSTLGTHPPDLSVETVEKMNRVVQTHNARCGEFEAQVVTARNGLASDMEAESSEEYKSLANNVVKSQLATTYASEEVKRIEREIAQLEQEIVEYLRPATELNEDLKKYLGHGELQLAVKETGYEITRNGAPAQSLSEGETTAIALLYFLKSLDDRRFDSAKGVVVLDDPVSSLDANALFLAFGFIRERTQDSAQLFILTHNFTFFRNVKNWFHNMPRQRSTQVSRRPARLYMLEWQFATNTSQRLSTLRALDPLLEWYESEYHYLFARIYRESQKATTALTENYVLPNMARRLLEGFLAFRVPQVSGELWTKLKGVDFDEARKTRILRFINTHSHNEVIGEPEHDPSLLAEARPVLQDLLKFIEALDPDHYRAMEELVNRSVVEDEE